jgi:hypothetical protein
MLGAAKTLSNQRRKPSARQRAVRPVETLWKRMTAMRRIIAIAALLFGPMMLWAAILPLTAQPAPATSHPAMSKALFLCRTQHGIDQACAAALAKALIIPAPEHITTASARVCHGDPRTLRTIGAEAAADQSGRYAEGAPLHP